MIHDPGCWILFITHQICLALSVIRCAVICSRPWRSRHWSLVIGKSDVGYKEKRKKTKEKNGWGSVETEQNSLSRKLLEVHREQRAESSPLSSLQILYYCLLLTAFGFLIPVYCFLLSGHSFLYNL